MKHQISKQDKLFIADVQACTFPVSNFDHRAHLRLAYAVLSETNDIEESVKLVKSKLIGLLQHAGIEVSVKYHQTLTQAWLLVVHHFMHQLERQGLIAQSANEFIEQCPSLLDSRIMLTYYSEKRLFSDKARAKFVSPDLQAIPSVKV